MPQIIKECANVSSQDARRAAARVTSGTATDGNLKNVALRRGRHDEGLHNSCRGLGTPYYQP